MNTTAHVVTAGMSHDEAAILDSLLDDIVETAPIEAVAAEHEIAAIEGVIEKAEANEAIYAEADADTAASTADTPLPTVAKKTKASKKEKKAKPEGEKVAKAPKEPKEAKPPRLARHMCHGHESRVLAARLGERLGEFLVLEVADAGLDAAALKVRQDEILAVIDGLAKKVGEKATMLFGYMMNGGKLNEVMLKTFTVLARDGKLTSGAKGNLQLELAEKYSPGTAASQANQMFMLLPALAITVKEKGMMVANPDSMILMKMNAELSLA